MEKKTTRLGGKKSRTPNDRSVKKTEGDRSMTIRGKKAWKKISRGITHAVL